MELVQDSSTNLLSQTAFVPPSTATALKPSRDLDRTFVAAAISGGPDSDSAFRKLVERYSVLVERSCMHLLDGEIAEADEAAQDVWFQVFKSLPKFEGRSTFRTWLFSVVKNVCRQRRRALARQTAHRTAVSDFVSEKVETERAGAPALSRAWQTIDESLGKLSEEQQKILMLRFVSGLSIDEIADHLAVKLSTAKMRLYRSLDALREVYRETEQDSRGDDVDPLISASWIQVESEIRGASTRI